MQNRVQPTLQTRRRTPSLLHPLPQNQKTQTPPQILTHALEDTLENTSEDAAESKQDAEEAITLATEAKSVADQAQTDAEKALKSSRGETLMVYAAIVISLDAAALNFIGPLQITRKHPG